MKSNWSNKSLAFLESVHLLKIDDESSLNNRLYFDDQLFISFDAEYPLRFRWNSLQSGHAEEIVVLIMSLQKISEQISWFDWIKLRGRELENFLRDQNHIAAIPMELLDFKKIDFYLELLFEEHFKLRVCAQLACKSASMGNSFLEKHRYLDELFSSLSTELQSSSKPIALFSLYQISPSEVIYARDKSLPLKFTQILGQQLQDHFALSNLKFVAIEL